MGLAHNLEIQEKSVPYTPGRLQRSIFGGPPRRERLCRTMPSKVESDIERSCCDRGFIVAVGVSERLEEGVGRCHAISGRGEVDAACRPAGWRRASLAGSALICCAALVALVMGGGTSSGHSTELMQGIALTGKNSFLLSVPSGGGQGGGGVKLPSWSQLTGGVGENPKTEHVVDSGFPDDAEVDLPTVKGLSSSTDSKVSSMTTTTRSSSSSSPTSSSSDSGVSDGSYDAFLSGLLPPGGDSAKSGGDDSSDDRSQGDSSSGDSGGDADQNPPSDDSGRGDDASGNGGDGSGSGDGDGGERGGDEGGDDGGNGGNGGDSDHGEHRSATVVVHRLSREFEQRFGDSEGAYDFCIRSKLTQEELAACIKHMLMKSRPDYKPSDDQALLDKISVLKLQIREEETQSARALREMHDRVQELKTRLLTAVPYDKFRELRVEYETKLRALQRLVTRFTHDMATENEAAKQESYGGTAREVARALGARIRRSESDEQIKALWRLLARRIQDRRLQPEAEERGRGEERGCCKSIHKKIAKLLPFGERRAYIARARRNGRGDENGEEYVIRDEEGRRADRREEGSQAGSSIEGESAGAVHRLSRAFDQREAAAAAAGPGVAGVAVAAPGERNAAEVTESAQTQTAAALSAAGNGAAKVEAMPSLPSLPELHLPKSLARS